MDDIRVKLGNRSYAIKIGYGILAKAGAYVSGLEVGINCAVITNVRINRLYGGVLKKSLLRQGISPLFIAVPDSESSKSNRVFSQVVNKVARNDRGRKPFIIAFGGGVIGDLAGFVAAAYRRGVPLVQIPTTLVAQVDSSIGGKVAIDLPVAKNLVGAFYQPKIVISDTLLLKTLPKREIRCGLAEIIKYSVISSRPFFNYLCRNIESLKRGERKKMEYVVKQCCSIKSRIVSADEKDTGGIRALLNYGHTVGHAIEAASGYGAYSHGEAIAIGMIAAAGISAAMGMLSEKEAEKIKGLIVRAGLPIRTGGLKKAKILRALYHDKKFSHGVNRFVLPARIGRAKIVEDVPGRLVRQAAEEIAR